MVTPLRLDSPSAFYCDARGDVSPLPLPLGSTLGHSRAFRNTFSLIGRRAWHAWHTWHTCNDRAGASARSSLQPALKRGAAPRRERGQDERNQPDGNVRHVLPRL